MAKVDTARQRQADETARLGSLDDYNILDTPAEESFDGIVLLATQLCKTPVALVSLVSGDRQWFKARVGFDPCETPLSQSVCAHALWRPGLLIIPDLTLDPRTRNNTLVTGSPHIRFYAGARLETPSGLAIGTICVIDTKPRPEGLTPAECLGLEALARQVMAQLELRRGSVVRDQAIAKQGEYESQLHTLNATLERRIEAEVNERNRIWKYSRDLQVAVDRNGIIRDANEAWTTILGWPLNEIIGRDHLEFNHADHHSDTAAALARGFENRFDTYETRFLCKDGTSRWISWVAESHGEYLYGSGRDITKDKVQADALIMRTAELDRVWRNSHDLQVVVDEEGIYRAVSPASMSMLGWAPEEMIGRPFFDFLVPGDSESARRALGIAIHEPLSPHLNQYRHRDGSTRWLSWTTTPEGGLIYCYGRDITVETEQAMSLVERGAALKLYGDIVQSAAAPICAFDTEYRLIAFNQAHSDEFFRIFAHRVQLGEFFPNLFPAEQAPVIRSFMARALQGEAYTVTEEFGDPDLAKPYWEVTYSPLRDKGGDIIGAFHYAKDITERLRATAELASTEDALRQSQKMEAVGQLTGGLAHDFNNLLAVITGSLELLALRVGQGRVTEIDKFVTAAQTATRRASSLTHRLLAFSRRQTLDPKQTGVNQIVAGMRDMIDRTVGPTIAVETVQADSLWMTLVDPNQLENALLNLCINAKDAMPDGGQLTVETSNQELGRAISSMRDLPPGDYVALSVSDTGCGMPPEVVARAFEPFYTTKPTGQGTGLGLSMIYGFARQSDGQVRIHSEVGRGTTVTIYLPRSHGDETSEDDSSGVARPMPAERGQTVLVVDDEANIRMLIVTILEELGYSAIEAHDGPAALKILQSAMRIDLLVTDVGMPGGMNGRQLADAGRALRPSLKTLFITGYAETAVLSHGHLDKGMAVIVKPFAMDVLANRIKAMITEGGHEAV